MSRTANRVVVLGNGASGKSRFARELAASTGIECVELDTVFWGPDLVAPSVEEWRRMQEDFVSGDRWILDGDLGPYDALDVRLRRADTVVLFEIPTIVCAWRAVRRSRARFDFWKWLFTWRRRYLPRILDAIRTYAPDAEVIVIRNERDRAAALTALEPDA